jgi:hypothetical protein
MMAYWGKNSSACLIKRKAFEWAVIKNTLNRSVLPPITSNV